MYIYTHNKYITSSSTPFKIFSLNIPFIFLENLVFVIYLADGLLLPSAVCYASMGLVVYLNQAEVTALNYWNSEKNRYNSIK